MRTKPLSSSPVVTSPHLKPEPTSPSQDMMAGIRYDKGDSNFERSGGKN
jgi:hypothetical protein